MSNPNELLVNYICGNLEPLEALVDIVEDDHYKCDIDSDEECHLLADGGWQIKYQHGALRQAKEYLALRGLENNSCLDCESCQGNGWVLCWNEEGYKDLQKCDACRVFQWDEDAKKSALEYVKDIQDYITNTGFHEEA